MKKILFLFLFLSLCHISSIPTLAADMPPPAPGSEPQTASASFSQEEATHGREEDRIVLIETEPATDEEGNVTMTLETAEDIILPVTITMKGSGEKLSFTISRNGQFLKMKPGSYRLTKVIDGNGKKLPSGASLSIPKESGRIYFDFNKPKDNLKFQWSDMVKANALFLLITAACYYLYRHYLKANRIE